MLGECPDEGAEDHRELGAGILGKRSDICKEGCVERLEGRRSRDVVGGNGGDGEAG